MLSDKKQVLLEIVAARLRAEGLPTKPGQFVDDCRPLAREILNRSDAPNLVTDEKPVATTQAPWEGLGWVSAKWVPVWFDGVTWRRNNSSGTDVTATITYWLTLQAP